MKDGIIKGSQGDWEVVIGLEIHAQVTSEAKLFSKSKTAFGAAPNTQVSIVDAAMPGMLPVINGACVEQAVKTGLGLKAKIHKYSVFDRKNYFYADLPQGYQISQFKDPIVGEGMVSIDLPDGSVRNISIERLHLEQDAGKSMHDQSPVSSFIDLNRSGIALMEIVTKPDLRNPEEAGIFIRKLRSILRYLGTCDGDMEKGSMRCDVNVSVRKVGDPKLGTRCEIKNVNSVRFVMKAIEFEAVRQVEALESGQEIEQQTRLFDASNGTTRSMRSKEEAHDYRYFPDPDLLPLTFDEEFVTKIRASLPELPDQKKQRYQEQMGLSAYDASILVAEKAVADYFEEVAALTDPKLAANWISAELFAKLNKLAISIEESPISSLRLAGLLQLIQDGTISGKIAKDVFEKMCDSHKDAKVIVEEEGLVQVTDVGVIEEMVASILAQHPDKVEEFKSGKEKLMGFFVGQVMQASKGKANPKCVNEILRKQLT